MHPTHVLRTVYEKNNPRMQTKYAQLHRYRHILIFSRALRLPKIINPSIRLFMLHLHPRQRGRVLRNESRSFPLVLGTNRNAVGNANDRYDVIPIANSFYSSNSPTPSRHVPLSNCICFPNVPRRGLAVCEDDSLPNFQSPIKAIKVLWSHPVPITLPLPPFHMRPCYQHFDYR